MPQSYRKLQLYAIAISVISVIYNGTEGAISIAFGAESSSKSLVFFGIQSGIEVASAAIVLWRFRNVAKPGEERGVKLDSCHLRYKCLKTAILHVLTLTVGSRDQRPPLLRTLKPFPYVSTSARNLFDTTKDMKAMHINNINQLPSEILVELFLLTQTPSHEDMYQHLRLSSVCRYWRRVINDHGAFWTSIFFSPWKGEEFIRNSLTRSRSQKLSVFLTFDDNSSLENCNNSRLYRARIMKIITTFDNLLQTEGHRIKLLCLVNDRHGKISRAVLGKALPVLKTFIYDENLLNGESDSFAIVKAAKTLENLNMSLQRTSIRMSSLSELKPSFERLRNLKLRLSDELKKQIFISILSSCYKLESLTISINYQYEITSIHLPSVITLTNLISLDVDCYALVHQLRAPALRRLKLHVTRIPEPDQHGHLILNEYDLSPITHLAVKAFNILFRQPHDSSLVIEGLTGPKPRGDPWMPFRMDQYTNYGHIDLKRDDVNISFSGPTQFCLELPMYHIPINGITPPDFQPSLTLSKILSKLHNLERLYTTPFSMMDTYQEFSDSNLESLKRFLNIFFENLISSKVKQLGIMEVGKNINILRLIFDIVNNCFSLSNLDTIELGNFRAGLWHSNHLSVHDFAEELVNSLQLRQKAGHRALPRLEVDLDAPLPKTCIAEAAILGTRIVQWGH